MKQTYKSMDSRTGYPEGDLVELTFEELGKKPFPVKFKLMESDEDLEHEKKENADKKSKEELRILLSDAGLSNNRTDKVVEKYSSLEELKKHADKGGFDDLTDEFLKKNYGKPKQKKKKESEE